MGQKVNPISLRIGITRNWNSNWFVANKIKYKEFLHEDLKVRNYVKKKFFQSGISKLEIERSSDEKIRLVVYCSKPGLLIGRKGVDIENLRKDLNKNKDRVTSELANLVGSSPDQIAITRNATESLDLVISGFP